jgi:hypothetical protein
MKKITIRKGNVITNQATFETQELADAWRDQNISSGVFGKPERWLAENEFTSETIEDSVETSQVERFGQNVTVYKFAADYTITEEDVTAEYEDLALKAESVEAIQLGADLIADIRTMNKKKLADGSMTEQQFSAMLLDSNVEKIERALWNGSFVTAKGLINALSDYYTSQEKAPFVAKIDAFLAKWQ